MNGLITFNEKLKQFLNNLKFHQKQKGEISFSDKNALTISIGYNFKFYMIYASSI